MAVSNGRRRWQAAALGTVSALLLTGCLSEGGDEGGGGGGGGGGADSEVEIMYAFSGADSDNFQAAMNDWAEGEGISLNMAPTPDFDKLIRSRVAGNNTPDIAIFPQPGITLDIARSGKLADLSTVIDDWATYEGNTILIDAATGDDGAVYAAPYKASVKSLVWYPKGPFEAAGYTAPTTQEELLALTDQIKADGTTPWCVGIESAAATGWPATDWMEDYVLRIGGPDFYDQWIKHEVPFNDPIVQQAGEEIAKIWFTDGNVLGGRNAITSNNFATAANPMFEDPPGCFLHRQASFLAVPGTFPDDVVNDLDNRAGVFSLPPMEAGDEASIMGAGDLAGLFSAGDEAAEKTLNYIVSREIAEILVPSGGFIAPQKDFDLSIYPNQTMRDIATIGYEATAFKFDGSDVMPGEVGAGSFWREMVSWVGGADLAETLQNIEDSWPAS